MNRRGFLKQAAKGLAAVPVAFVLGEGIIPISAEAVKKKFQIGEFAVRYKVEGGPEADWEKISIPVFSDKPLGNSVLVDWMTFSINEANWGTIASIQGANWNGFTSFDSK